MTTSTAQRFSRRLDTPVSSASWPPGFALVPFRTDNARAVHRLLVEGYAEGPEQVPVYESWSSALLSDAEYDPNLVFTVVDQANCLAGVALCWTSAFVKDLVVSPSHRRRGVASSLLQHVFTTFQARGASAVDLKTRHDNVAAISLYRHVGMELEDQAPA